MTRLLRVCQAAPAWVFGCALVLLAIYFIPHLVYFSNRPALILSEPAARAVLELSGPARERTVQRLISKNVEGVVFREETLRDLESSGRVFVASGEELLRLFKLQSVASYYVFEQIRDKQLNPAGSYIFFSESALFERVQAELKLRLPPGSVAVYERGIFRGDASFPDNFILESPYPPAVLRTVSLGWPVDRIKQMRRAVEERVSDTVWPVLWTDDPWLRGTSVTLAEGELTAVRLRTPFLRFPYESIHVVDDLDDLLGLARGSDLMDLEFLPPLPQNMPMLLSILAILAWSLSLSQWIPWSLLLSASWIVLILVLMPAHRDWVIQGTVLLLPAAALISWMGAADRFRARMNQSILSLRGLGRSMGGLVLFLMTGGWLLSTLIWQHESLPLDHLTVYGLMAVPAFSCLLFLSVWGIEVSNRPIYPRHLRTGMELALALGLILLCRQPWVLFVFAALAWARWLVLIERTRGRTLEHAPGTYAAFFCASALTVKLFVIASPLMASALILSAYGIGHTGATVWIARTEKTV